MSAVDQIIERRDDSLRGLQELLRIPSISSLPEHAGDVVAAANWVAARLDTAGAENVKVMPTSGHPVVYGDWLHAPGKPTVLVYGHFDVQPVDPLNLWTTPPFEPRVQDGRIYARGADDMKGNLMISVLAFEALLRSGNLAVNVKFIFEGEEEIGSPDIPAFVNEHKDLLASDLVISGDGFQWSETQPMLLIGLKGACCSRSRLGAHIPIRTQGYTAVGLPTRFTPLFGSWIECAHPKDGFWSTVSSIRWWT